jgi:hypothetical protein
MVPDPLVALAAATARLFLLARFFLFLPAFFPGAGAGTDCIERIIVVLCDGGCLYCLNEKLTKMDNLSIFFLLFDLIHRGFKYF